MVPAVDSLWALGRFSGELAGAATSKQPSGGGGGECLLWPGLA